MKMEKIVAHESIKGPDMSRNEKLAGMTVYSKGFNVTYDARGYAVRAVKADYTNEDDGNVSPKARPIEEVLAELGE